MSPALGLGTYKVRAVKDAARAACAQGAAWVDTAPNYGGGRAQIQLAAVLADHPGMRASTKTGFFTPEQASAAVTAGVLLQDQAATGYSLMPAFVRWQVERSVRELGRTPDVVYVHNPERADLHVPHIRARLREAMVVLEELADAGQIGGYGVATWDGLKHGVFDVPGLVRLAEQAAGSDRHHLVALQQPLNLVDDAPIRQALDGKGPLAEAHDHGLLTVGAAPLRGGELLDMVTDELAEMIRPGISPAAACLLVAASTPGLDVILVSASSPGHWAEAQDALALPLGVRRLREITDVLAAP
ncbi:aldo/keto reductase [Streptomyces mobaraensis]|uniref:Aldo/keto reductase n=1 Tax=Streptomyces mobaraensis TaxID=35621 RepID=A0A5N5VXI9_STRMB|nr:aldo/keto reductase [Streptomyces mobaraensis]KAB7833524.1 aldo/keto reductase [Streptomyces mobaraensis]